MTFHSLSIQLYPKDLTGERLASAAASSKRLLDLDHIARRCGPYALADWAHAVGLEVQHVDNCWCRVPVTEAMLISFARDVLNDADVATEAIGQAGGSDGRFVIEAEEF